MSLNLYIFTMWICIHKGENRNLKSIPQLSDQKPCIEIWYTSSLRKENKSSYKSIKMSGYIRVYIFLLNGANKENTILQEKLYAGMGWGAWLMSWITGTADVSPIPLFKELISKVCELMYRCTLASV